MKFLLSTDDTIVENLSRQSTIMFINLIEMIHSRYILSGFASQKPKINSIETKCSMIIVPFEHHTVNLTHGGSFGALASGNVQFAFLPFFAYHERMPYLSVVYPYTDYYG